MALPTGMGLLVQTPLKEINMKNQMKTRTIFPVLLLLTMLLAVVVPQNFQSQISRIPSTPQITALQFPLSPNFSAGITKPAYGSVILTGTTNSNVLSAAGAGLRNYISQAQCTSTAATDDPISITDGAGGTVLAYIACPESKVAGSPYYFNPPLRGSANTTTGVVNIVSITTAYVSLGGYVANN